MGFVAIADRVRLPNTLTPAPLLDQIAAALAGCTCAASHRRRPSGRRMPGRTMIDWDLAVSAALPARRARAR